MQPYRLYVKVIGKGVLFTGVHIPNSNSVPAHACREPMYKDFTPNAARETSPASDEALTRRHLRVTELDLVPMTSESQ